MLQSLNTFPLLLIACWIISILAVFIFLMRKIKKLKRISSDKETLDIQQLNQHREQIIIEKEKLKEKNRKVWQMGEAALKEKHKIDEQLIQLQVEKETFAAEKKDTRKKLKNSGQPAPAFTRKEAEAMNSC